MLLSSCLKFFCDTFRSMGGHKLRLSTIKRYKKKRKARLASKTNSSASRADVTCSDGTSRDNVVISGDTANTRDIVTDTNRNPMDTDGRTSCTTTAAAATVATDVLVTSDDASAVTDGTVTTDIHVTSDDASALTDGTVTTDIHVTSDDASAVTDGTVATDAHVTSDDASAVTDGTVATDVHVTSDDEGKKELALQHLGKMMHLYRNANKNELKRSNALINLQYIVIMIYLAAMTYNQVH